MKKLDYANKYIKDHYHLVKGRPKFHLSPEIGWMNDPNGFIYFNGLYHLYYQYNPYSIDWDSMHWGHATSKDLIHWDYSPVVMANDKLYDSSGAFSGSAIERDGKLYFLYTGHVDANLGFIREDKEVIQTQCLATSDDGYVLEKYSDNPIIGRNELPQGYKIYDFRDPKVFENEGVYYCVIAARNSELRGEILLYRSDNLKEWRYINSIYKASYESEEMIECPDFFELDGKYVLIFSIMPYDKTKSNVVDHTRYTIGSFDFRTYEYTIEKEAVLDHGKNFYAPQSTKDKNSNRIMVAWMQQWNVIPDLSDYNYNGIMSFPRVLSIKDNSLVQQPITEIKEYFSSKYDKSKFGLKATKKVNLLHEACGLVELRMSQIKKQKLTFEMHAYKGKKIKCEVDFLNKNITIQSDYYEDQNRCIDYEFEEEFNIEFLFDLHTIEIFLDDGMRTLSLINYKKNKGTALMVESNEEILIDQLITSS